MAIPPPRRLGGPRAGRRLARRRTICRTAQSRQPDRRARGVGRQLRARAADRGRRCSKRFALVSREVRKCPRLGGLVVMHSLGGGTGSGLGAMALRQLRATYPKVPILSCAVLPSTRVSSVVTEPYNALLAIDALRQHADACLFLDNEALVSALELRWRIPEPTHADLNAMIAEILGGATASVRFPNDPGGRAIGLDEAIRQWVPRPGLKFAVTAALPLSGQPGDLLGDDSLFSSCRPAGGIFHALAVYFRGRQARSGAAASAPEFHLKAAAPRLPEHEGIVLVANNSEIGMIFERICAQFDQLWSRQAFANWYLGEGMTPEEIAAARRGVGDLAGLYARSGVRRRERPQAANLPPPITGGQIRP
ncbi:MAG: hypothetical protein R3F11_25255 [Verrucomicrobiales bacterium]